MSDLVGKQRALVMAVSAKGVERLYGLNVRDAAHEAFHAQHVNLRGPWERERIHAALLKKHPITGPHRMSLWVHEVEARAVEQLVCRALGADPQGDLNRWLATAICEAEESELPRGLHKQAVRTAEIFMKSAATKRAALRVLRLLPAGSRFVPDFLRVGPTL